MKDRKGNTVELGDYVYANSIFTKILPVVEVHNGQVKLLVHKGKTYMGNKFMYVSPINVIKVEPEDLI